MRLLGDIYEQGLGGVKADASFAKQLFSRAREAEKLQQSTHFRFLRELALNGDRSAQGYLGSVYRNGWLGQAADEAKAAYWEAKSKEVPSEP